MKMPPPMVDTQQARFRWKGLNTRACIREGLDEKPPTLRFVYLYDLVIHVNLQMYLSSK